MEADVKTRFIAKCKTVPSRSWAAVLGLTFALFVSQFGLYNFLCFAWWCGLLMCAIRIWGFRRVITFGFIFTIYVVVPTYFIFLATPVILFALKLILCLLLGTFCMIVVLTRLNNAQAELQSARRTPVAATSETVNQPGDSGNRRSLTTPGNMAATIISQTIDTETKMSNEREFERKASFSMTPNQIWQENSPFDSSCVICQADQKCVVFLPCAHLCACKMCRNKLLETSRNCPICRTGIVDTLVVYM